MLAFFGLIFGIIVLMFIGGTFGYYLYKIKELLIKIKNRLDKPVIQKPVGPTQGSYRPAHIASPESTTSIIEPKTPQQIEKERMQDLRDQGYNVE